MERWFGKEPHGAGKSSMGRRRRLCQCFKCSSHLPSEDSHCGIHIPKPFPWSCSPFPLPAIPCSPPLLPVTSGVSRQQALSEEVVSHRIGSSGGWMGSWSGDSLTILLTPGLQKGDSEVCRFPQCVGSPWSTQSALLLSD